jgi:hypothetical protein
MLLSAANSAASANYASASDTFQDSLGEIKPLTAGAASPLAVPKNENMMLDTNSQANTRDIQGASITAPGNTSISLHDLEIGMSDLERELRQEISHVTHDL